MQPMAVSKNKMMNSTSSRVRDALQPVRQSKSAKSIETKPVSNTAEEKNKNSRQPRRSRGGITAVMLGASGILVEPGFHLLEAAVREPENRDEQQREKSPRECHADVRQFTKI